jgi:hypothetical protein
LNCTGVVLPNGTAASALRVKRGGTACTTVCATRENGGTPLPQFVARTR